MLLTLLHLHKVTCPTSLSVSNSPSHNYGIFAPPATCATPTIICSSTYFSFPANSLLSSYGASITLSVGSHIVVYRSVDLNGNTATCNFSVHIIDTESPLISTCPPNLVAVVNSPRDTFRFESFGAGFSQDNVGVEMERYFPDSNFSFPSGITTVSYTVNDAAGNNATCTFQVTVFPRSTSRTLDVVQNSVYSHVLVNFSVTPRRSRGFQFSLVDDSALPLGLTLSQSGEISGVPSVRASTQSYDSIRVLIKDTLVSLNVPAHEFNVVITVWPALVFYEPSITTQFAPLPKINPTVKVSAQLLC
jgi:hypothetical protein